MTKPFEPGDGITIDGLDGLLSVIDAYPDYDLSCFIILAEDVETRARVSTRAEYCTFVPTGQLDLFNQEIGKE